MPMAMIVFLASMIVIVVMGFFLILQDDIEFCAADAAAQDLLC